MTICGYFFLSKQKRFWQDSGDLIATKQVSQPSTYIMYFASRNRIVLSLKSMGNNVFNTCVQDISKYSEPYFDDMNH